MKYLFFLLPFLSFGQIVSNEAGHILNEENVGLAIGGSQIALKNRADGASGPAPGAARTAIPDFTGLTIYDVAAEQGWSAGDMSSRMEAAITANEGTGTPVVLMLDDDNGTTWEFDSPITAADNTDDLYIYVESGVTVQMGASAWGAGTPDDLWEFDNSDNIHFYAYGATFDMDKSAFTSGEHAMVFIANNATNIELWGGTYQDSGGDGLYINEWSNFEVHDIVFDNNARQGISIIAGANGVIDGCEMKRTATNGLGAGSAGPWAGIDFEPNPGSSTYNNIVVKNSNIYDNDASAIDFAIGNYDGSAYAIDITIQDLYINLNMQSPWTTGAGEFRSTCASDLTGNLHFTRVFFDGSPYPGIYSTYEADGALFTFEDVAMYNINQTSGFGAMRFRRIGTPCSDETTLGGVFFDNTTVYNNVDDYIIEVPNITGNTFKNVTGNIKAITDYTSKDITYEAGYSTASNVNVTLAFDMDSAPPTTTLNIAATEDIAAEDTQNDLVFTVTRTSSEVDYALPFRVAYSGTATIRDDYHGLPSGFVIPAGSSSTTITVVPRNDVWTNSATEGDETVIITLQAMTDAYTVGTNSSATGTIKESL